MSFAAATRRFRLAIARASLTATSSVFQLHPTLAAQILGTAFDSPSSRIVDFDGSNDAESVSFKATAGLKSVLKRPTTASDLVGTSSRTSNRVVICDPQSYDFREIPSCFHLDHHHSEYFQATRMNYCRAMEESKEYQEAVGEVCRYWLKPENFQMLSLKNQRILKMKWPQFHLTLPERDDVVDFNINCKADRAVWRERQANQQPIDPIVNQDDDLAVEFECDAGTDSVATDTTDDCPSNDAEPSGNEAEEIAEAGLERAVVDGVETDFPSVVPRSNFPSMPEGNTAATFVEDEAESFWGGDEVSVEDETTRKPARTISCMLDRNTVPSAPRASRRVTQASFAAIRPNQLGRSNTVSTLIESQHQSRLDLFVDAMNAPPARRQLSFWTPIFPLMPEGNTTATFVEDEAEVSFDGGNDEVSVEDETTVEPTTTIPRMLKELESALDGDHWAPVAGCRSRRALVRF